MRCAVILSGCGVRDGSEIHEAVTAMLSLTERGHAYECYAPDRWQTAVVDHAHGCMMDEKRNTLVESARIARGAIRDLKEANLDTFDAVLLPGGFGAAIQLCDFGKAGARCKVDPELEVFLKNVQKAGKPIGLMCIAPVIAARVFGDRAVRVTIGDDAETARACEAMGARHVVCRHDEVCVDEALKIVTTPAYMKARDISQCYASAKALVSALEKLCVSNSASPGA